MSTPSATRRFAAIRALTLFAVMVAVVVLTLYRNTSWLAIGLPGLAVAAAAAWWLIRETGIRSIIGASGVVIGLALLFVR